ncbi:unnamed protein product, partial [Ectocarpus fasciculatus]
MQQQEAEAAATASTATATPSTPAREKDRPASAAAAAEEVEVVEGSEVEGAFDPTPELRSSRSDKARSLRFVTADEEAKIRKEELARVFSSRGKPAAAAAGASEDGGGKSGEDTGVDVDGEEGAAGEKASGDGGSGLGHTKGDRIKAFGAVLEKTLSKTLLGRAPPPGTSAAAAAAAAAASTPG